MLRQAWLRDGPRLGMMSHHLHGIPSQRRRRIADQGQGSMSFSRGYGRKSPPYDNLRALPIRTTTNLRPARTVEKYLRRPDELFGHDWHYPVMSSGNR